MDVPGKPYIQNINVIVHSLQFFLQCGIFLTLLYIVAKKICHLFHKDTGFFCILHHCKLYSCIQGIKKEMRINLRLEILKLCLLEMCFHQKLPLYHLLFFFHAGLCPGNVKTKIIHHGIKGSCYRSKLIPGICWGHLYIKIPLTYQLCSFCHISQRQEHLPCCHDQKEHSTDHHQKHDHHITDLQISHNRPESCISLGIFFKKLLVQLIHRTLDITVKLQTFIIFLLIFLHIPASLGSYSSCGTGKI